MASKDAGFFWYLSRADCDQPTWGPGVPRVGAAFCACSVACQAGEARARAAAVRRRAAMPQVAAVGQPDAIAIFMRRTLIRTSAPIFNSLRRMVPQLALAKDVCWSPIRRTAQSRT